MFNENDIRNFYHYLGHHPDEYTEIRAIEWTPDTKGQIERTWVNNEKDFTAFCKKWNHKRHLYAGVNPRSTTSGTTTDVPRITGIPFDIDSQREPGHEKDAATDQEITEAYKQLEQMLKLIKEKGFNEPYIDFSGNGFRVIQKVDIQITDHKKAETKLKAYFMEYKIHVPTLDSIFDIPRIIKVPGTWSIKGPNTEERPHRMAKIRTIGSTESDQKLKQHILNIKIQDIETEEPTEQQHEITEETLKKLTQAQKNKDIQDLYNGNWEKYGEGKPKWSRSEAESSLIYRLFFYGLTKNEVTHVMSGCKIGKWQESGESYRKNTLNNAYKAYLDNPYRFFDKKDFIPKRLAEEILQENKFMATSEKSDLWTYHPEKGIWKTDGTQQLQKITINKLKNMWKSYHTNETEKYIRFSNYINITEIGGPKHLIVLKNGVLNLETYKLETFNPNIKAISAIPVEYKPDTDCPKIKKFLTEVVETDDIQKIFQIIGYCLYKSYPLANIFIFTGTGRNGKSVLIKLISSFLGEDNISSVDIQNLTDESFRSPELYGKLANINGDLPSKPIKDTGLIKKCTGQDPLTVAKKHKDPFQFYNHAKLLFAANDIPKTYDNSDAMHRRLDIIDFPNKFDSDNPKTDPELIYKLITPEELSGLLNESLKELRILLENGAFHNEKDIDTRRVDYIRRTDPVQYFGMQYLKQNMDPEHYIGRQTLYNYYVEMCRALNKIPTNSSWFSRNIRRYVAFLDEGWVGKETVWRGISVDLEALHVLTSKEYDPTKTTKTISSLLMVSMENEKETSIPTEGKKKNNGLGELGGHISLETKRKECLTLLRSGLDTVEKISEKMEISGEGVEGLLKVLKRDGLVYSLRPGVWGTI